MSEEMATITIEYSDGTEASVTLSAVLADIVAAKVEEVIGRRMNVRT